MKILVVNPAEYGFTNMVSRASLISTPRVASVYKKQGHDVSVFNIRPDLIGNKCTGGRKGCMLDCKDISSLKGCVNSWKLIDKKLYYRGKNIISLVGERACGNWENERYVRKLVRMGRPLEDYVKKLNSFRPDVVAISQVFTYLWEGVKETLDITRKYLPSAEIWIGGMYPTLCPDHAASLGADRVVRKPKGCTEDFTRIDLSVCEEKPVLVGIFTQLGCPNNCGYCAVPMVEGNKQIRREVGEVLDEIEYYVSSGINQIEFLDSNLLVGYEKHFKLILEGIIERGFKINLKSYGGVEARLLTQEMLELMCRAGFSNISIPIESSSPEILRRWGRTVGAETWKSKVGQFGKELFFNSFVMIGCLNQTLQQAQDTIDIVREAGVAPIPLPFTPIPGTREYMLTVEEFGRSFSLESLHPILFPLATKNFTVAQMNDIYTKYHSHSLQGYGNIEYTGIYES